MRFTAAADPSYAHRMRYERLCPATVLACMILIGCSSSRTGGTSTSQDTSRLSPSSSIDSGPALPRRLRGQILTATGNNMSPAIEPTDQLAVATIVGQLLGRGDIVAFTAPPSVQGATTLLGRVVGLAGETVEGRDCGVFIDGRRLTESYIPSATCTGNFVLTVMPPSELFVMGDSRSNSQDSRFYGPVEQESVIGVVASIVHP